MTGCVTAYQLLPLSNDETKGVNSSSMEHNVSAIRGGYGVQYLQLMESSGTRGYNTI